MYGPGNGQRDEKRYVKGWNVVYDHYCNNDRGVEFYREFRDDKNDFVCLAMID